MGNKEGNDRSGPAPKEIQISEIYQVRDEDMQDIESLMVLVPTSGDIKS